MRYILVIDETSFYHPELTNKLLSLNEPECVGCLLVTGAPSRNSLLYKTSKKILYFGFYESIKFTLRFLKLIFKPHLRSVAYQLRKNKIDFMEVKSDINTTSIINWVEKKHCDFIFASTTLIIKKELLDLPRFGCINRHSSLLPGYAGLWPIFHACLNGEKETGVTLYLMSEKIDQGKILAQKKYSLDAGKSLDQLYQENFSYVPEMFKAAVDALINKKYPVSVENVSSYYGFPEAAQIKEFRRLGGKFI